jgi:polyhydroxybutyrate depolymerase
MSIFSMVVLIAMVIRSSAQAVFLPGSTWTTGLQTITIARPEGSRTFDVYIPTALTTNTPRLVLALHALVPDTVNLSGSFNMRTQSRLDQFADTLGTFIVVFPQGTKNAWNWGPCCNAAVIDNIDDVGFLLAVIDTIKTNVLIDPLQVYALGYSSKLEQSDSAFEW